MANANVDEVIERLINRIILLEQASQNFGNPLHFQKIELLIGQNTALTTRVQKLETKQVAANDRA